MPRHTFKVKLTPERKEKKKRKKRKKGLETEKKEGAKKARRREVRDRQGGRVEKNVGRRVQVGVRGFWYLVTALWCKFLGAPHGDRGLVKLQGEENARVRKRRRGEE